MKSSITSRYWFNKLFVVTRLWFRPSNKLESNDENGLNGFGRDIAYCVDHIIGNNGMENGMKPEETVQKYVTLEEYSDSYK